MFFDYSEVSKYSLSRIVWVYLYLIKKKKSIRKMYPEDRRIKQGSYDPRTHTWKINTKSMSETTLIQNVIKSVTYVP